MNRIKKLWKRYQLYKQTKDSLAWLKQSDLQQGYQVITDLYHDVDIEKIISLKRQDRDCSNTYGEITLLALADMLRYCQPKANEVFYDLGSGVGKAVLFAGLLYPHLQCTGVEINADYVAISQQKYQQLSKHTQQSNMQFVHKDLLVCDISNADIIFINATAIIGDAWDQLDTMLINIKSGARIMLTTKQLNHRSFDLIDERPRLMSWGMNSSRIYQRR